MNKRLCSYTLSSGRGVVSFVLILFFTSSLFFLTIFNSVSASELLENSWNTKTPMTQARANFGVAVVNGKIYAIGGGIGTTYLDINERYDPVLDTWVTLKPMPTPRSGFAIATYEGKIYCIGGYIVANYSDSYYEPPSKLEFSVNEVYDTLTNSWSVKASMPVNGSNLQAHVVGGKIFVLDVYGNLTMYDPIKDSWTTKSSIPIPNEDMVVVGVDSYVGVSAAVDDKILCYLQRYALAPFDYSVKFMSYDTKNDVWCEESTPLFIIDGDTVFVPFAGSGFTGVTSGVYVPQKVYVFSAGNEVLIYDPVNEIWSTAKGIPTTRNYFGVVVVDDIFYVIGGLIDGSTAPACATNEQYIPIGYHSTAYTLRPTEISQSKHYAASETFLIYLTVAVLALIAGVVILCLFFRFKKRSLSCMLPVKLLGRICYTHEF
jgi:hypothetical protein